MRRLFTWLLLGKRLDAIERNVHRLNNFAEDTCDVVNPLLARVDKVENTLSLNALKLKTKKRK